MNKKILQDNYVEVYFHGSLRLDSFNSNKSDLYLVRHFNVINVPNDDIDFD